MIREVFAGLALCTALAAMADREMAPYPYVVSGQAAGRHYFRMLPATDPSQVGVGTMLRVGQDGDEVLWKVEGWYARRCFVHEGATGPVLIRLGNWPRGRAPAKEHLGLAFYRDGRLLKEYSTADLVKDPGKVEASVSHYPFLDWDKPPRLAHESGPDGWRWVFSLVSADGVLWRFDPETGEVLPAKAP